MPDDRQLWTRAVKALERVAEALEAQNRATRATRDLINRHVTGQTPSYPDNLTAPLHDHLSVREPRNPEDQGKHLGLNTQPRSVPDNDPLPSWLRAEIEAER